MIQLDLLCHFDVLQSFDHDFYSWFLHQHSLLLIFELHITLLFYPVNPFLYALQSIWQRMKHFLLSLPKQPTQSVQLALNLQMKFFQALTLHLFIQYLALKLVKRPLRLDILNSIDSIGKATGRSVWVVRTFGSNLICAILLPPVVVVLTALLSDVCSLSSLVSV